ncbi:MAG: tetratricopeptide repeat protein [Thermofilum sp.]
MNEKMCADLIRNGRYREAIDLGLQLLNTSPAGYFLHACLARAYFSTGDFKNSLLHAEKMMELAKTDEEFIGAYNRLGLASWLLGKRDHALTCFQRQLNLARKLRDRTGQGVALNNMALIYQENGNLKKALRYYKTALTLTTQLDSRATILSNIADTYADMKRYREAVRCYGKALRFTKRVGEYHHEVRTILNLGYLYVMMNRLRPAGKLLQMGLQRIREIGDTYWESTALLYLTDYYVASGDYRKALEVCCNAYSVLKRHGYDTSFAITRLGYILKQNPPLEKYFTRLTADNPEVAEEIRNLGIDPNLSAHSRDQ